MIYLRKIVNCESFNFKVEKCVPHKISFYPLTSRNLSWNCGNIYKYIVWLRIKAIYFNIRASRVKAKILGSFKNVQMWFRFYMVCFYWHLVELCDWHAHAEFHRQAEKVRQILRAVQNSAGLVTQLEEDTTQYGRDHSDDESERTRVLYL